jgi:hypothetical protein
MMRTTRRHREKKLSRGEEPDHEHEDEQEGSIGCSVDSNFTVWQTGYVCF